MCHPREENIVSKDNTTLVLGSGVLDWLIARFDALKIKISAQSTSFFEQLSHLHRHMEKGFLMIDGQMLCYMDQL